MYMFISPISPFYNLNSLEVQNIKLQTKIATNQPEGKNKVQSEVGKFSKGGGFRMFDVPFSFKLTKLASSCCNFYSNWQSCNLFQSYRLLQDIHPTKFAKNIPLNLPDFHQALMEVVQYFLSSLTVEQSVFLVEQSVFLFEQSVFLVE